MRSLVLAGLLLTALALPAEAQTGTPVNVCGTLTAHRAAVAPFPGELVVAGERFAISTDARQNVHPAARVGADVCLTGTWVMSQTAGRNLIDMTLAPRSAQMPSTTTTTATPSASAADLGLAVALLVALAAVASAAIMRGRVTAVPRGS